jgi:tight adherence protein B
MGNLQTLDIVLLATVVLMLLVVPVIVTTQTRQRRLNRRIAGLHDVENRGVPAKSGANQPVRITLGQPEGRLPQVRRAVSRCFGYDSRMVGAKGPLMLRASIAGVVLAVAGGWVAGPFAGLPALGILGVMAAGGVLGARFMFTRAKRAVNDRLLDQFPDAIGLIVRAVRAGIPVAEGLRVVSAEMPAPVGPEFKRVIEELAVGVDLETALWSLAARTGLPEYRFFVVTVVLQRETGGNLTETLDNLADVIRKRRAVRQRAHALSAEARTSTYVLAGLPFVTGAGLYIMNPVYLSRLFTEPQGKLLLAAAACSLIMGLFTMSMLIRRALS